MASSVLLRNGIEIAVDDGSNSNESYIHEGLTDTSSREERAEADLERVAHALPAVRLGELIAQIGVDLVEGARNVAPAGWKQEYEIEFGLLLGGGVDVKFASCKAEASMSVKVRFESS